MTYVYIAVMAGVTYLIRVIPLTVFRKKIENKFVKSFLHYVPYACLTAMTFPAILYATNDIRTAAAGLIAAVMLSIFNRSLTTVAIAASAAVFISDYLLNVL